MNILVLTEKELRKQRNLTRFHYLQASLPFTTQKEEESAEAALITEFKRLAREWACSVLVFEELLLLGSEGNREVCMSARAYRHR